MLVSFFINEGFLVIYMKLDPRGRVEAGPVGGCNEI